MRLWVAAPRAIGLTRMLKQAGAATSTAQQKAIRRRVVEESVRLLRQGTPVRNTGKVRRGWRVVDKGNYMAIENRVPAATYLEHGTNAHGPVSAPALFVPLGRRAAGSSRLALIRGVHYVLAKRVRGIRALGLLKKQTARIQKVLVDNVLADLSKLWNNSGV